MKSAYVDNWYEADDVVLKNMSKCIRKIMARFLNLARFKWFVTYSRNSAL